jgi:hypothetical protein
VRRIDQVIVSILLGFEGEGEGMRVAAIEMLGTDIRAPLERDDRRNLIFQVGEGLLSMRNLLLRSAGLGRESGTGCFLFGLPVFRQLDSNPSRWVIA